MKSILPALVFSCLFTLTPEVPGLVPPSSGLAVAAIEPSGAAGKRATKLRPRAVERARPKASESMILFTVR